MLNVLDDSLLPVITAKTGLTAASLPHLLALYGQDEIRFLSFIRPHQQHPWHAFCVQLAALALHRAGEAEVMHDAERWRDLLRGLTVGWPGNEPWSLVVDDPTQPAFMQPPVPEGTLVAFKNGITAPDDLDVLVTSKNHGFKQGKGAEATAAEWVAALVSLQTAGGYSGGGSYGVARMNGGFASRPGIGLAPSGGPGARWRRDVLLLLKNREWFFNRVSAFRAENGEALLWCLPWDGAAPLALDALDPWFIEVCRRVRLERRDDGGLACRSASATRARITADTYKGNIGDPWTPINKANESAAYNSLPTYAVMSEVLFNAGKWVRPLLLDWHPDVDAAPVVARFDILIRGQGKTEGYHERSVPMDEEQADVFADPDAKARLAELSEEMLGHVRTVFGKRFKKGERRFVKPALLALLEGGPKTVNINQPVLNDWADKLLDEADREIDRNFFFYLFKRAAGGEPERLDWLRFLRDLAWTTFKCAVAGLSKSALYGPRAVTKGKLILRLADFDHGPFYALKPARKETTDDL